MRNFEIDLCEPRSQNLDFGPNFHVWQFFQANLRPKQGFKYFLRALEPCCRYRETPQCQGFTMVSKSCHTMHITKDMAVKVKIEAEIEILRPRSAHRGQFRNFSHLVIFQVNLRPKHGSKYFLRTLEPCCRYLEIS